MQKQIAVIILNYLRHKDSYACIKSVRNSLQATIFLVDNSADEMEKKIIKEMFGAINDIRLLFPEKNLGFSAGVNLALKEAVDSGFHHFLILNNDAVLLKDAGRVLNRVFDQHPGSLIAPSIKWGQNICRKNYYHKYLGLIYTTKPSFHKKGWISYLTGCALAFDRTTLDMLGYFDESFFMYGEDAEISHRARTKRISIVILQNVLVYHKGSQSAQMASLFYEYHIARAHYLLSFCILDHPFKTLLSLLGKSITLTARAYVRSLRYHNLNPLIALLLAPIPLRIRPRRS